MANSGVDYEQAILTREAERYSSGLCWSAVFGGAFVAAALSLILLALGAGFGLEAVSPWTDARDSVAVLGTAAIVWLIVMQAISAAMGGYLTGRLRGRWTSIHNDEVHFRDTANGFLAWAVSLVLTVVFLTTSAATILSGRQRAGTAFDRDAYFSDRLLGAAAVDSSTQTEASRILRHALRHSDTASDDSELLTRLVAAKAGLSPTDAEKRVSDTLASARESEDRIRKEAARTLLWSFVALLVGAFCSSYAATIGGRQRDHVKIL